MPVDVLTSVAMVLVYDKERNDMVAEAEACREMGVRLIATTNPTKCSARDRLNGDGVAVKLSNQ
jgi:hypothetical protein